MIHTHTYVNISHKPLFKVLNGCIISAKTLIYGGTLEITSKYYDLHTHTAMTIAYNTFLVVANLLDNISYNFNIWWNTVNEIYIYEHTTGL